LGFGPRYVGRRGRLPTTNKAAEVAKRSFAENKTVREILLEEKLVEPDKLDEILDLRKLTDPGIHK
jgi:aspartate ammonia-lyase